MMRVYWTLAGLGLAALAGCRMCAGPYDYTGPVVGPMAEAGARCHGTHRSGSVLSGMAAPAEFAPHTAPTPATPQAAARSGRPVRSPGELDYTFANDPEIARGQIISITDRRLDEVPSEGAEAAEVVQEQQTSSERGWTAREVSTGAP